MVTCEGQLRTVGDSQAKVKGVPREPGPEAERSRLRTSKQPAGHEQKEGIAQKP